MEIAYQIYKPLLNKSASKAVSAHYLSKILIEEVKSNTKLIEDILHDKYLMYIVNAIKYVTNTESEVTININNSYNIDITEYHIKYADKILFGKSGVFDIEERRPIIENFKNHLM